MITAIAVIRIINPILLCVATICLLVGQTVCAVYTNFVNGTSEYHCNYNESFSIYFWPKSTQFYVQYFVFFVAVISILTSFYLGYTCLIAFRRRNILKEIMICCTLSVFLFYISGYEIWYASGFSVNNQVLINSPDTIRNIKLIQTWAVASAFYILSALLCAIDIYYLMKL